MECKIMAKRIGTSRIKKLIESLSGELSLTSTSLSGYRRIVEAKTSDYTITSADSGKILTTEGALGTVIFTLPAPSASTQGMWVDIVQAANQIMTVTCAVDESIISQGDLDLDQVSNSSPIKIGANCTCFCTGTKWIVNVDSVAASYWTFTD
jgi:hypothetical protein